MKRAGFTLLELLVATAITALLVVLLAHIGTSAGNVWRQGASQAETYSTARGAISILGRELEGAVIDLDIGFWVDRVADQPGNCVLKFLRRRDPDTVGSVEKTAYQLAWASRGLLPFVQTECDEDHPVPVLIRTSSTNLDDVYDITSFSEADAWVRNWGTLQPNQRVETGKAGGDDGVTVVEVAAEYVLGWQIVPQRWSGSAIASDDPADPKYYGRYLTSDQAPGALEVRLAVVPSQSSPQLRELAEDWKAVHARSDLFDYRLLGDSVFDRILKRELRHFSTTYYLSSRTP